jgi:hypothetical protein
MRSAALNDGGASGRLTVDSSPFVAIPGPATPDSGLITHVKGATRLSAGTIVIADGYSGHEQSLKGFGNNGQLVWSSGRQGGGPGEFQALGWFAQCGQDSLFTWDDAQSRLSVLDAGGQLARVGTLPGVPLSVNMACSRSGNFAIMTSPAPSSPLAEQFPRLTSRLTVVDSRGDSLWSLPDVYLGQNRPLGTITRLALGNDRLYVGTGDSAYVDEYDLSGQLIATFQVGEASRQPRLKQYEQAIDQLLGQMPGKPEDKKTAKEQLLKIPMPDRLPSYSGLLVDPSGMLWVVTSLPGDDTTRIRAFTPSGESVGEIRLPFALRILEVGSDYLLGVRQGKDGQEVVALYRYTRK